MLWSLHQRPPSRPRRQSAARTFLLPDRVGAPLPGGRGRTDLRVGSGHDRRREHRLVHAVPGEGIEPSRPEGPAGLSHLRLPISPPGRVASQRYASAAGRPRTRFTTTGRPLRPRPAGRSRARRPAGVRIARVSQPHHRGFATTTPSTMSTTTSVDDRPRTRTATTGPPGSRRIVRGAPGRRGGERNAGTTSPAAVPPRRGGAPVRRTELWLCPFLRPRAY